MKVQLLINITYMTMANTGIFEQIVCLNYLNIINFVFQLFPTLQTIQLHLAAHQNIILNFN